MTTTQEIVNYLALRAFIRTGEVKREDLTPELQELYKEDLEAREKKEG